MSDVILGKIARASDAGGFDRAMIGRATRLFAILNGWKATEGTTGFLVRAIGREHEIYIDSYMHTHDFFDHPIWFREAHQPYRPVAVVGQPYCLPDGSLKFRGKLGTKEERLLSWWMPPKPLASFHYPGSCYFCVVTRMGIDVKWLPEQLA